MGLTPFLFFLLASVGLTLILTHSDLAELAKARLPGALVKFLDCPQCVGFWAGLVLGLWLDPCCGPLVRFPGYGFCASVASMYAAVKIYPPAD